MTIESITQFAIFSVWVVLVVVVLIPIVYNYLRRII